jgi:heme/copper-type cytochrome/quinol oxidase subunit 4
VENILAAGRQRRFLVGLVLAVVALALAVVLVILSAGPAWFALVFVLAWLAAIMLLQARDRT